MSAAKQRLPHQTTEIGTLIGGRYQITDEIGSGGFGRVFRAEHLALGRSVALKLLSGAVGRTDAAGARFRREASAAGRLKHPNCVDILDFAEGVDGRLYMVMELLEGEPLTDTLARGRIDAARALHITRHVLAALGHAHAQGIVHRDVKPGNVFLVTHRGDADFAKLLDFGIAKLIDSSGDDAPAENANLTQDGFAIGSPTYMSPEQATAAVIDGRSDLYSASVLLFEMLTGRVPFKSDDKLSLLGMHISQPAPRLEGLVGDAITPAIKARLQELLDDGMAKKSTNRIASAADYIERIDAIMTMMVASTAGALNADALPEAATATTRAATPAAARAEAPEDETGTRTAAAVPRARSKTSTGRARVALWSGAVAAVAIAFVAIFGVGVSGYDKGHPLATRVAPLPAPAAEPDEILEIEEDSGLADIDQLIDDGNQREAKKRLIALQSSSIDPGVFVRLGHIYIDDMWWADAFTAYQRAFELDPSLRSDPRIIEGAIRSLMSRRRPGLGERFLRDEIGVAAIDALREASRSSKSLSVRRRAKRLLTKLERRSSR